MANKSLVPPGLSYLADNINTKHNLLGAGKGAGSKWAKDLRLPKEAPTIFFAGCGYQYSSDLESLMSLMRRMDKGGVSDLAMGVAGFQKKLGIDAAGIYRKMMGGRGEDGGEVLRDAVKVLQKLGLDFGYLADDEPCCGGILHYMGFQDDFAKHARDVNEQLKSHKVAQIVGIVPSCTYTLRNLLKKAVPESVLEVKHFSQVLAEKVPPLGLKFPRTAKVTFHDPCQLVRYLGIVEEPRVVLKSIKGIDFVEPEWTKREWATCCGGGGGFEAVFPEMSQMLAVNRARELMETGAEIIVTSCPGCVMQLKAGLKELKADKVEVLDLAEVVAMAMGV